MKFLSFLIATFLGIGKIPLAPGTWASLAAVPLFYPLIGHPFFHLGVLVVVFFLGVWATGDYAKGLEEIDPSSAVFDEVLGMGVAMLAIPHQWPFVIMSFILFRLFDIWKPYPIRRIEKLAGGWGIMADDLVAGFYALVWVHIGRILVDTLNK